MESIESTPITDRLAFGRMSSHARSTANPKKPTPSLMPEQPKCKIVLLGSYAVGKTSIVNRFMYEQFSRDHEMTMGVDYFTKTIAIDETPVSLRIWDTAGQEQYSSLIPMYIRDTQVAIIVYDISNENSFEAAQGWYAKLTELRNDGVRVVLVGNKSDLPAVVSESDVKKFADDHKIAALAVSAKLGTGISELFQTVVKEVLQVVPLTGGKSEAVIGQPIPTNGEARGGCFC
jgi:small GTP-binding protein